MASILPLNASGHRYNWGKVIFKLQQNESIDKVCIVHNVTTEEVIGSLIMAQVGCDDLLVQELINITENVKLRTIQKELVLFGEQTYMITSIQDTSYYGRSCNPGTGGIFIYTIAPKNAILIATYTGETPFDIVPLVESVVDEIK